MKLIPLTQGRYSQVDDEDFEYIVSYGAWRFQPSNGHGEGYAVKEYKNKSISIAHLVLKAPLGYWVDHIDGNGLNNQKANLRVATPFQNSGNRARNKNNKSGYKGVSWSKTMKKWKAQINPKGVSIVLGYFIEKEEAARVYDKAAKEHYGEFARLNIVEEQCN